MKRLNSAIFDALLLPNQLLPLLLSLFNPTDGGR
jgi:hypothetical protein